MSLNVWVTTFGPPSITFLTSVKHSKVKECRVQTNQGHTGEELSSSSAV